MIGRGHLIRNLAAGGDRMESIQEAVEMGLDWNHPLLEKKVLVHLFSYLTAPELKIARLVCLAWREHSTPYLQDTSLVTLKGTCDLCGSEWKVNKRSKIDHNHRETISLYRFVTQLHLLTPQGRERLFFRNFQIRNLNLYLIGRVNTEPTRYFLGFVKLFGSKVFSLRLDNVQICPSESLYSFMPMFPNLETVIMSNMSVWMDPLTPEDAPPETHVPFLRPPVNPFLKSLTINADSTFEEPIDWEQMVGQCPELQELNLDDIKPGEISNCLKVLGSLKASQLKNLKIRRLSLVPRTNIHDDLQENVKRIEPGSPDKPEENVLSSPEIPEEWTVLLLRVLQLIPFTDLRLQLPYKEESYDVIQALLHCSDSLSSLSLLRKPLVILPETDLNFRKRAWEMNQDHWMMLPFVRNLEISHTLTDSLEDIKNCFPALQSLRVNVVFAEVRAKMSPYHTFLHTNIIISLKNCPPLDTIQNLEWVVDDPRHVKSGRRTVVYRSQAVKHFPRLFPNLTSLSLSLSSAWELYVIFKELSTLKELTVLRNSLHCICDEDLCGNYPPFIQPQEKGEEPKDGEGNGEEPIRNLGIRQMKYLKRLTLENNNSCLTDRSIAKGFIFLHRLRSLHIRNGRKLTMKGLRLLNRCPYLVYVSITNVRSEEDVSSDSSQLSYTFQNQTVLDNLGLPGKVAEDTNHKTKLPIRLQSGEPIKRKKKRPPTHTLSNRDSENRLPILLSPIPPKNPAAKTVEDVVLPPLTPAGVTRPPVNSEKGPEHDLKILQMQHKKRQAKRMRVFKDGKYEMGPLYRIGGKRYDIVRTAYKLRGRMYQLAHRHYERETDEEYSNIKKGRTEKEFRRKMAEMEKMEQREITEGEEDDEDGIRPRSSKNRGEEEECGSDYEFSIKDFDEDDEVEEYCDEEEEREVIYFSAKRRTHSPDSEASTGEDEEDLEDDVIYLEDTVYEGDKECYDSSPPPEEEDRDSDHSNYSADRGFLSEPTRTRSRQKLPKKSKSAEVPRTVRNGKSRKKIRFMEELKMDDLTDGIENMMRPEDSQTEDGGVQSQYDSSSAFPYSDTETDTARREPRNCDCPCENVRVDETITKFRRNYNLPACCLLPRNKSLVDNLPPVDYFLPPLYNGYHHHSTTFTSSDTSEKYFYRDYYYPAPARNFKSNTYRDFAESITNPYSSDEGQAYPGPFRINSDLDESSDWGPYGYSSYDSSYTGRKFEGPADVYTMDVVSSSEMVSASECECR